MACGALVGSDEFFAQLEVCILENGRLCHHGPTEQDPRGQRGQGHHFEG
jgi:hypothetical protein